MPGWAPFYRGAQPAILLGLDDKSDAPLVSRSLLPTCPAFYKTAGQPGSVPFPTVFHPIVTPRVLIDYCRGLGFSVLYFREFRGMIYGNMEQRNPILAKGLNLLVSLANALVLWRKDLRNGDYHILLVKA